MEDNYVEESDRQTVVPKVGKRYEVTLVESNEKINVKILSRADKASGNTKIVITFGKNRMARNIS